MYAHYFEGRGSKEVVFTTTPALATRVASVLVDGRRTARRIAKERGAQAWNF